MNHSAQLFIFPLFWWEHWVCLKLLIKTNTGRPHTHTCLFSPALKKKTTFTIWRRNAILHLTWDRVHLIKQALCALPLPCGKCLRQSRALSPWAAQAAEMWILHGHSSRLLFITPQAEVRVFGLQHPLCQFSRCSHESSTQSNGKIKGLCTALPGCENCISPLVPNEAKSVCLSRLSLLTIQVSRAWRQSFPSNVYYAVSVSHLREDSCWKCLQSCLASSPHTVSSPNSSHPRWGAWLNFPWLRGRMCPMPRIKGAKHSHCQSFLGQSFN